MPVNEAIALPSLLTFLKSWQSVCTAATSLYFLPLPASCGSTLGRLLAAAALNGNVLIETSFFDEDLLVCKTLLRVYYDA